MNNGNLKPWPKGVSGNPGGKAKIPEALRGILSLTQLEVTKLISKYARMSYEEISTILLNKSGTVLELAVCSIFVESIEKGDFARVGFLLERSVGKVKDIEDDSEDQSARAELAKIPLKELLLRIQENLPEAV